MMSRWKVIMIISIRVWLVCNKRGTSTTISPYASLTTHIQPATFHDSPPTPILSRFRTHHLCLVFTMISRLFTRTMYISQSIFVDQETASIHPERLRDDAREREADDPVAKRNPCSCLNNIDISERWPKRVKARNSVHTPIPPLI